jgi:hypothetical protein
MNPLVRWLNGWPGRVAQHLQWVAPLFDRAPLALLKRESNADAIRRLP